MDDHYEVPDSHIKEIAEGFCDAAVLLDREFISPPVVKCNAAMSIELFLKSLDSHWVEHSLMNEQGVDAYEITATPNLQKHELDELFRKLPVEYRDFLNDAFAFHRLHRELGSLEAALSIYRNTFVEERYCFEERQHESDGRPVNEIVQLACFFRDSIGQIPTKRY